MMTSQKDMTQISDNIRENQKNTIERIKNEVLYIESIIKKNKNSVNVEFPMSYELFKKMFKSFGDKLLYPKNRLFVIDKDNETIIKILWEMTIKRPGNYESEKGILLLGRIGSGKTVLMNIFIKIIDKIYCKKIHNRHAIELAQAIATNGLIEMHNKLNTHFTNSLFIDDIGKEPETIKHFGQDIRPIADLYLMRYSVLNIRNYATSNFNLETLTSKYGEHVIDRFKEMFNIFILPGSSRRV